MKKRIVVPALFLILVAAVALVTRGRAVEVTFSVVRRDTLSVTIAAEGITRARDRFTVAAPISGRLTRIDLEAGDHVTRGQRLGQMFPAPEDPRVVATARAEVGAAEARYREAEGHVLEAELQADQAEREVARRRPLAEMGAIPRERMEQAELAAVVARQRRESAEAALASARAALEAARARLLGNEAAGDLRPWDLVAPVSGRVLTVPEESERVVLAGSPLVVLADADGLEVVLDVLSEDAVRVQPGQPIVIDGWGGEGVLHGAVRSVTQVGYTKVSALGVEEQRVDVIADLVDLPPSLGTGYRVSGEIVVWHGTDALLVPTSALFRNRDSWQTFVEDGGRARRRDVVVGRRSEGAAEILDGLVEGDRVILFPPETIDDGTPVRSVPPG